jgi:Fe-S cluster assembly protein SufD
MATLVATSLYNKLTEEFESRKPLYSKTPKSHLSQLRSNAFELFKSKGFPSVKEEDWRFTSLVPFLNSDYQLVSSDIDTEQIKAAVKNAAIPSLDAYLLVLVNGSIQFELSTLPDDNIVSIQSLKNVVETDLFSAHVDPANPTGGNSMVALNSALFTDGFALEVHKDKELDKPLQIVHVYTAGADMFYQPRHLVVAGRNAKAELLETSVVLKGSQTVFINSVTQWVVKDNAYLLHYNIQNNEENERFVNFHHVTQQRTSRFDNFTFSLPGADLIRNNLEITLNGTATETHLYGLYLVGGRQLTDNHTALAHRYPNCESNELYKGVLMDHGKAVFNGKVFVEREAQKTNAFQKNNNLLLSNKAQVYTKPQLEIYADDVKCSHGCTVGQFDPTSLFYLRSRGIGEEAARKLLVEAFMFDVTEKIDNEPIKAFLKDLIFKKLGESLD